MHTLSCVASHADQNAKAKRRCAIELCYNRSVILYAPPLVRGDPPPVGGLPPRWTGPPLRSVALSAAGEFEGVLHNREVA